MLPNSILLVDHDPTFLKVIERYLRAAGYAVETANSREEALARVAATNPTVAVVDLQLPDEEGYNLLQLLAARYPQVECILLTGDVDLFTLIALYDLGNVFNHHRKPLDELSDLSRDISRALERAELKTRNAHLLSELREAREEIRKQGEMLMRIGSVATLGQIVTDMTEELEAPLHSLTHYAQYLCGKLIGEPMDVWAPAQQRQIAEYIQGMEQTAQECLVRLERIRRFIIAENAPREWIDLHQVIHDTFSLLRHTLEARGIQLRCQFAPYLAPIQGRLAHLQQALTHIALNAVHAMPKGGTLTLTTELLEGNPAGVRIGVQDTGVGIEPEALPRIFEPFFTTRGGEGGTGLGLTITQAIVQEHGGEIQVISVPNEGTTFLITFPTTAEVPSAEERLSSIAA
ncbi:MAG TPA: hybrid sensor histidine kinase/response regulator [Chthonomonadales bacterium]|nr:hybrid sensor histidine kinase/response regulator [Chthonomonadales bacterium]